jgi:hypothetical protein
VPSEILSQGFYRERGPKSTGDCPNPDHAADTSFVERNRRLVWPDISDNLVVPAGQCVFEVVRSCTFCEQTVVELHIYSEEHGHGSDVAPDEVVIVWPKKAPRDLDSSTPADVQSLYREASTAEFAGALRGAAALYRAAVEEFCRAQGATGKDLKQKINNLATKGVDPAIVHDLHEARLLGNWSLHAGITFNTEEVADVAGLIDEAINILYVEPSRRAVMEGARKARRDASHRS